MDRWYSSLINILLIAMMMVCAFKHYRLLHGMLLVVWCLLRPIERYRYWKDVHREARQKLERLG